MPPGCNKSPATCVGMANRRGSGFGSTVTCMKSSKAAQGAEALSNGCVGSIKCQQELIPPIGRWFGRRHKRLFLPPNLRNLRSMRSRCTRLPHRGLVTEETVAGSKPCLRKRHPNHSQGRPCLWHRMEYSAIVSAKITQLQDAFAGSSLNMMPSGLITCKHFQAYAKEPRPVSVLRLLRSDCKPLQSSCRDLVQHPYLDQHLRPSKVGSHAST